VPKHWEVKRLRFLVHQIDQGWSPKASNVEAGDGELGVLKLSAVHAGKFVPSENKMLEEVPEGQAIQTPQRHDVLVTRANTPELVGDACSVSGDFPELIIPDLIYRLKVDLGMSEERFVSYFLLSKQGRAQIESNARGSSGSMVKLGQGHLKNFQIPSPPQKEQREIADYVDDQTGRIDMMMGRVNEAIARLTEYRIALITAATTGKIDVRGVKIPHLAA
jgi:type I restriction enzyme S subunit